MMPCTADCAAAPAAAGTPLTRICGGLPPAACAHASPIPSTSANAAARQTLRTAFPFMIDDAHAWAPAAPVPSLGFGHESPMAGAGPLPARIHDHRNQTVPGML